MFVPKWAAALREHVDQHGYEGRDKLFRFARRTVQKAHTAAVIAASLPSYTIHDHRHTAAVTLARAGLPLNLLQKQLGHRSIKQTMRYAEFHPDYGDMAGYMDRAGAVLGLGSGYQSGTQSESAEIDETL